MRKIGINTIYNMDIEECEQLPLIKEAGFDCVMLNFFVGDNISYMYDRAVRSGLEVANIHAPVSTVNSVWKEGIDGEDYIELQKERIDFCHSGQIPVLVLHTTFLKNPPPLSDIGIKRHIKLCEYAEKKGVHLAFENVEPYPHLDEVLKIAGDFHGFCWDVGHNVAYAPHIDFAGQYSDRLRAVHIHDNLCRNNESGGDKHWLPYDGNINWEWYVKKVKNSSYKGPLTMEISTASNEGYKKAGFEKFITTACERIQKVRDLMEEIK